MTQIGICTLDSSLLDPQHLRDKTGLIVLESVMYLGEVYMLICGIVLQCSGNSKSYLYPVQIYHIKLIQVQYHLHITEITNSFEKYY